MMSFKSQRPQWQCTAEAYFGTETEVHVWQIPLLPEAEITADIKLLSDQELQRARQLLNEDSRKVFYSHRIVRRKILSHYLGVPAQNIILTRSAGGKPYIQHNPENLQINSSHCQHRILLSVSNALQTGIDIEKTRIIKNWQKISQRVFPRALQDSLNSEKNPQAVFTRYWTVFEAVQKCLGEGVFGQISPSIMEKLFIRSFMMDDNFHATLACEPAPSTTKVRYLKYNGSA